MIASRRHPMCASVLLVLWMLASAGCLSIMREEPVGTSVRTLREVETHAVGAPRIRLDAHGDGLGWALSAETRMARTTEERVVQEWRGRRYVLSPLSIFPGLFQCPVGLLHLFNTNPNSHILSFGCARLVMFEPLDGVTSLPGTLALKQEKKTEWEPLRQGLVQLLWAERPQDAVSYALSDEGTADVRLSDLLSRLWVSDVPFNLHAEQAVVLRLRYGDGTTIEQKVPVSSHHWSHAARLMRRPVAKEEWPSPTILQIQVEGGGITADEAESVREQLARLLLQRRMCVLLEGLHDHLLDEQRVQYSGVVDGNRQVRLGKLLAPSIQLIASAGRSDGGSTSTRQLAVQIRDVREGRIFGAAMGSSRSDLLMHAAERALTELDLLMAKAPKIGCPR